MLHRGPASAWYAGKDVPWAPATDGLRNITGVVIAFPRRSVLHSEPSSAEDAAGHRASPATQPGGNLTRLSHR